MEYLVFLHIPPMEQWLMDRNNFLRDIVTLGVKLEPSRICLAKGLAHHKTIQLCLLPKENTKDQLFIILSHHPNPIDLHLEKYPTFTAWIRITKSQACIRALILSIE